MIPSLQAALTKLSAGNPKKRIPSIQFDALPLTREDSKSWNKIEKDYKLLLPELSALMNARCIQPQPAVNPNEFPIIVLNELNVLEIILKELKEMKEGLSKKSKSANKMSRDEFDEFNALCLHFDALPSYRDKFNNSEVEQIHQLLVKTCDQLKQKASNQSKVSSNRHDELLVVQEAISGFNAGLVELLIKRGNVPKAVYKEEAKYAMQQPSSHSCSSSSSANPDDDIVINGRIDFTFHSKNFEDLCLGMIECKHSKLNLYDQQKKDVYKLNQEGKKVFTQCFVELLSNFSEFKEREIYLPSYVTVLTTGKKWFFVERQVINGVAGINYTKEVELMDTNWNIVPSAVEKVVEMIQNFLNAIEYVYSEVDKAVRKKRRRLQFQEEYVEDNYDEDNYDEDNEFDRDDSYHTGPNDAKPFTRLQASKNNSKIKKTNPNQKSKKHRSGHHNSKLDSDSWQYAALTEENLALRETIMVCKRSKL